MKGRQGLRFTGVACAGGIRHSAGSWMCRPVVLQGHREALWESQGDAKLGFGGIKCWFNGTEQQLLPG